MTFHTFIYCTIHADGHIIESETIDIPENYKCEGANHCDFIFGGILHDDGKKIKEIIPLKKDYERYGGGFKFSYFKNNYKKDSEIYLWLDLNS